MGLLAAKDVSAFMAKMQSKRDDLVRRGVNAAPLGPLFKAIPERTPEVAILESYASAILSGTAP